MNINDYVEITGLVPKKLKTKKNQKGKLLKRPFYGQIKEISGEIAVVKPRYQRFTVEVNISQLTVIDYKKFNKPQKKKRKSIKKPARLGTPMKKHKPVEKVTIKGKGPVKVKPIAGKETMTDIVAEKIKEGDKKCEMAKAFKDTLVSAPVPESQIDSVEPEPGVAEKPYNWVKDDPINKLIKEEFIDEHPRDGGVIIYIVIGILIIGAVALVYYLFS